MLPINHHIGPSKRTGVTFFHARLYNAVGTQGSSEIGLHHDLADVLSPGQLRRFRCPQLSPSSKCYADLMLRDMNPTGQSISSLHRTLYNAILVSRCCLEVLLLHPSISLRALIGDYNFVAPASIVFDPTVIDPTSF